MLWSLRTTGTRNKKIATQKAFELERKLDLKAAGLISDFEENSNITFQQAKKEFLKVKEVLSKEGYIKYRTVLSIFEDVCQPVLVRDINTAMIEDFCTERLKTLEVSTVNGNLDHLRTFINWCRDRSYLQNRPKIKKFPIPQKEPTHIPLEHLQAILKAIDRVEYLRLDPLWWKTALQTLWFTGMRRCEILRLRWEGVDFEAKTLSVFHDTSKTRRWRKFEECGDLMPVLREWYEKSGEPGAKLLVFETPWETHRQIYQDAKSILKKAGLEACGYRIFGDGRPTVCSQLLAQGHNLITVMHWMGHTNPQTTERYYSNTSGARREIAQQRRVVE